MSPMPIAALPVHANIAFLRIAQFGSRPVAEQAALKERLERHTRAALDAVSEDDRIFLDAEDGLVVVMFGDPGRALKVAQDLRARDPGLQLQAGLNFGPLALNPRGEGRVFGDGLTAAAAASRFASAERLLVTQDFAAALRHRHPERAAELAAAGDFTDTRVRQHSFYTPDARAGARRRRLLLAYGAGGVLAILFLGVAAREARRIFFPPLPAVLRMVVKPRGEIFIDGVSRGYTPPLVEIDVVAGRRDIQIRNTGFPPLEVTLDLKPGERTTLAHTFQRIEPAKAKPKPRAKAKPEPEPESDLWRDLKRLFSDP